VSNIAKTLLACGPFSFDHQKNEVTLAPGIYKLKQPIIFGIVDATIIENLDYSSSTNGNSSSGVGDGESLEKVTGEASSIGVGVK
jgi:hypothetical protein